MAVKRGTGVISSTYYDSYWMNNIGRTRDFVSPFADPTHPANVYTITDETIDDGVPDNGCILLDHIIYGNPYDTANLQVRTAASGGGTLLEPTESFGTIGIDKVRVHKHSNWIDVSPSRAGQQLYITYRTVESGGEASFAALIYSGISTALNNAANPYQTVLAVAGENISKQLVCVIGGVAYVADPSYSLNTSKICRGYVSDTVTLGSQATVIVSGTLDLPSGVTVSPDIDLFCGRNGLFTFSGDTSIAALQSGDYVKYVGWGYSTTRVQFNPSGPVSVKT